MNMIVEDRSPPPLPASTALIMRLDKDGDKAGITASTAQRRPEPETACF